MPFGDLVVLFGAGVLLFVPGIAVLLALAAGSWRAQWPILLGAAPVATVGMAYLSSIVTHALGVGHGLASFLIVTVLAVLVVLGVHRARGNPLPAPRLAPTVATLSTARVQQHLGTILGLLAMAIAAGVSVATWARGLASLGTVPQEHDTVLHTLMTAYIARSGNGAPGDSWPVDLLSGAPDSFYPQGFHATAALVVDFGADPVAAMNAMMVAGFAFAVPCGLFALGSLLDMGGFERLAGGAAALVAVVAYRPTYAAMHDGGILANAIAFALAPATVAVLVAVLARARSGDLTDTGARGRRRLPVADAVLCALVIAGAFAVHPTSAALVGVGVLSWVMGDLIVGWPGWGALRAWALTLGLAGALALIAVVPILINVFSSAETVAAWPRDFPVVPLHQSIGISLGMPYGGFLDPGIVLSQPVLAGLSLFGVAGALAARRHGGLVLAWLAWLVILMNFLSDLRLPVLTPIANLFYNSYVRVSGALAPYQWLLVGVAVVTIGRLLGSLITRTLGALGRDLPATRSQTLVSLLTFLMIVALTGLSAGYLDRNAESVATRYSTPDFFRVDDDDLAGFDFLAENVEPGERVMNSANDGSTFLYIYEGIPVVQTTTLGNSAAGYTEQLLADFGDLDTDRSIQTLVRDYNIRWVFVDLEAPSIGSPPELFPWWGKPTFSTPPAFDDLDDVDSLTRVFNQGSVSVYRVDERVFA